MNNQGAYPPGKAPTPKSTHHYLSWLASKLDFEESTDFLVEQLQPSWLSTTQAHKQYRWIFRLSVGLSVGLIGGMLFGLFVGLKGGLIVGLIGGLFSGLIGEQNNIKTSEKYIFSWTRFCQVGLIEGTISGLIGGLIFGLIFWLSVGPISGLSAGLSIGLICGLIEGLESGIIISKIDNRNKIHPKRGIRDSCKLGLIAGLSTGLIFGLTFGLFEGPIGGLFIGLYLGLLQGLIFGLDTAYQHLSLRIVLYQSGVSPWNYARFLEHAENHRFIQRTGGRYRFVHDLIRKRFAATLKQP